MHYILTKSWFSRPPDKINDWYDLGDKVLLLYKNISSLDKNDESSANHNALMISQDGFIIWRVQNFKEHPSCWVSLYQEDGKWFIGNYHEDEFLLDIDTGKVQYSHTSRAGTGVNHKHDLS